jgi:hypothetical protein
MAQVCGSPYTVGDLTSGAVDVSLSQLCEQLIAADGSWMRQSLRKVGDFKVVFSFTNDEGMRGEVTRTITVLKDCNYPQPENLALMESVCIVYTDSCSVNGLCVEDIKAGVAEAPVAPPIDTPPQINLRVPSIGNNAPDLCSERSVLCTDFVGQCACVLNRTVSIRQGQSYAACGIEPTSGKRIQPVATMKGDEICEPGVDAYDLVTTLVNNVEVTKNVTLTDNVMACPPAECERLGVNHETCAPHKFSVKGIQGCLPPTHSVEVNTILRVIFMVQDQTSQTTVTFRNVLVIDPCPKSEDGASQFMCPDNSCYSSEAACAFTTETAEAVDTDAPEVFLIGPAHVVHEYQVPYEDRFGVCTSAIEGRLVAKAYDNAAAAHSISFRLLSGALPSSYVVNNPTAPVFTCGAYAVDRGNVNPSTGFAGVEEDLTVYVATQQVMHESGGELQFLATQQGIGGRYGPLPGRYVYTYTVVDEVNNAASSSRTIDVVTRISTIVTGIRVPETLWGDGNTSAFVVNFRKTLLNRTVVELTDGEYFFGDQEHITLKDAVTASGEVTFAVAVDTLQLPQTPVLIVAKGTGSKAYWRELGYAVTDTDATGRRRLLDDIRSISTSFSSSLAAEPRHLHLTRNRRLRKYIGVHVLEVRVATAAAETSRRRRLTALADSLSSGMSSDLSLAAGNGTNLTQNVNASSTSVSPAIDYDSAQVASLMAEISALSTTLTASAAELAAVETVLSSAGGNPGSWKTALGDYWKNRLSAAGASIKMLQTDAEETLRVIDATLSVQQTVVGSMAQLDVLLEQQKKLLIAQLELMGEPGYANLVGKECLHRDKHGAATFYFNVTKYSIHGSPPPSPAPPPNPPTPSPPPPPLTPPPIRNCTGNTAWNVTTSTCHNATTRRRGLLDDHATTTAGRKLLAGSARRHTGTGDPLMRFATRLLRDSGPETSGGSGSASVRLEDASAARVHRRRRLLQGSDGVLMPLAGAAETGGSDGRSSVNQVLDWKGYGLLRGGASAGQNFIPPPSFIGRRYVSNTNKLVGGVLVHQTRNGPGSCSTRFSHLKAPCRGLSHSQASFGVDPIFRPPVSGNGNGEETMYNGELVNHINNYYNTSWGSSDVKATGAPYAFTHRKLPGVTDGFVAFLDIAASREQAANLLQFLKEGLFFDANTRHVTTQAVTYNANLKQLANIRVNFEYNNAGFITVTSSIRNMNVKWYTEHSDDNKDGINDGTFQMGIELTLFVMVLGNIFHEIFEVARLCKAEKSVSIGLRIHFISSWKYLETFSMALQLVSTIVWISYQAKRRADLFPMLRFDVYDNPASPDANYFLPRKKIFHAPLPPPPPSTHINRTGIFADGGDARYVDPFEPTYNRWELENDESGIEALGKMVTTINDLSNFLTLYFCVQGVALLLMVVRVLKLLEFQKHLGLTVKTLCRSGIDLVHFMFIFLYTLVCSAMVAHLMLGSLDESFATISAAFNFHFEIILGESVGVFAALLTDKSVVRTDIEYATLVFYSFFAPVLIVFIMINMVLGIVTDAFGVEKDKLREAEEPTVYQDMSSYFQQNQKVLTAGWPTYSGMLSSLGKVRMKKRAIKETSAEVLGKHIGGRGGGGGGRGALPSSLIKPSKVLSSLHHTKSNVKTGTSRRMADASSKMASGIGSAGGGIFGNIRSPWTSSGLCEPSLGDATPSSRSVNCTSTSTKSHALLDHSTSTSGEQIGSQMGPGFVKVAGEDRKKAVAGTMDSPEGRPMHLAAYSAESDGGSNLVDSLLGVEGSANTEPCYTVDPSSICHRHPMKLPRQTGWGTIKRERFADGLKAERAFLWGGFDVDDMLARLKEVDKSVQVEIGHTVGGLSLVVEMFNVIEDSDSDSDSDPENGVTLRRRVRAKAKGKTSAWAAIKKYATAPHVHDDWQVLIDDAWAEFIYEIKRQKAEANDASCLHTEEGDIYTIDEIGAFIRKVELGRQRLRRSKTEALVAAEVEDIVQSIVENKVQQYSRNADGMRELGVETRYRNTRENIVAALKKLNAFVQREVMWREKTELWNLHMESAIEAHEVALVGLYDMCVAATAKSKGMAGNDNVSTADEENGNIGNEGPIGMLLQDPDARSQLLGAMKTKMALRDTVTAMPDFRCERDGREPSAGEMFGPGSPMAGREVGGPIVSRREPTLPTTDEEDEAHAPQRHGGRLSPPGSIPEDSDEDKP